MIRSLSRARAVCIVLGAAWITAGAAHSQEQPKGKRVAVLIGVKRYSNANFSNLFYTERDVVEFSKLLKPQGFDVMLLSDSQEKKYQPTRANILEQLDAIVKKRDRDDILIFAFAGHGVQFEGDKANYFLPSDAEPNDSTTMISLKTVYEKLEDCGAGVKLMFVDACRNQVNKVRFRAGFDGDSTPAPPKGVCALFSCSAGQSAMEMNDLKHGLFFFHVLEGLRGEAKDRYGEVTVLGLAQYAMRHVKLAGYNQTPVLKGEVSDGTLVRLEKPSPPMTVKTPDPPPVVKPAEPPGLTAAEEDFLSIKNLTGEDAQRDLIQTLVKDPERTQRLIGVAMKWSQERDKVPANVAYVLGLLAGDRKDVDAGEKLLRIAVTHALKVQSPRRMNQAYVGLIDCHFISKKYDKAVRTCKEYLDLKTKDGNNRFALAVMDPKDGDPEFVEEGSNDTHKTYEPDACSRLAKCLTKLGNHNAALDEADKLITKYDHWQDRQLKGWIYTEIGQFEDAIRVYEDVIDRLEKDTTLTDQDRDGHVDRQRYLLSSIYQDARQNDKAIETLEKLLAASPDTPAYQNDLGFLWADNDMKLEEAEKLIRKSLEGDRKIREGIGGADADLDNGAYLDSLSWVLFKQKKFKQAKTASIEALRDTGALHLEILDHHGDILFALGENQAAIAAWKKGLTVASDSYRDVARKAMVAAKIQLVEQATPNQPRSAVSLAGTKHKGRLGKHNIGIEFRAGGDFVISGDLEGEGTWKMTGDRVTMETSLSTFKGIVTLDGITGIRITKSENPVLMSWQAKAE